MSLKSELILSLIEGGMSLDDAKATAERMEAANPAIFAAPAAARPATPAEVQRAINPAAAIPMVQGVTRGSGLPVPAITQSELKRRQVEAAVAAGLTLCPNCQQPMHDHLPGCARHDMGQGQGMVSYAADKRAVTKDPLPPVG